MSDLLAVRKLFVELTGRYDLVTDAAAGDFTDNAAGASVGADVFIRQGQKFLDTYPHEHRWSRGRFFTLTAAEQIAVTMTDCRSITAVYVGAATADETGGQEGRFALKRASMDWLYRTYNQYPSTLTGGRPEYYSPLSIRPLPNGLTVGDLGSFTGWLDVTPAANPSYSGLLLYPPADGQYAVIVDGLWYNRELTADADTNYWTVEHPMVLAWAAAYCHEVSQRNSQGAADWKREIGQFMLQLDLDVRENAASGISEVGDSVGEGVGWSEAPDVDVG